MRIRPARPADGPGIARVLVACYNIADEAEGLLAFANESRHGHQYLVAEEGSTIAGLVTWLMHGLPKHGLAELDRIAVLPEWRGQGVASQLVKTLVADAQAFYAAQGRALRKLYLLTHDDNARAHAFYEKMGFAHETTLKDHYYAGRPERVYSRFFENRNT